VRQPQTTPNLWKDTVIDLTTFSEVFSIPVTDRYQEFPKFSSNMKYLAIHGGENEPKKIIEVGSWKAIYELDSGTGPSYMMFSPKGKYLFVKRADPSYPQKSPEVDRIYQLD
jgi:hypothetical protein